MGTYGPWTQGNDYTRNDPTVQPFGRMGQQATDYPGPAPYDDEMNDAVARITADTAGAVGLTASLAVTSTLINPTTGAITITAQKDEGGGAWTAEDLLDADYYTRTYLTPNQPADAVGVELEATTSALVGASLHLVMQRSADPGASAVVGIRVGQTYATATSQLADFSVTPDQPANAVFDFNMAPYMDAVGRCALALTIDQLGTWTYNSPTSAGPIGARTNFTTTAFTDVTGAIVPGTMMTYMLHPPRHRWVYAVPQVPPVLPPLRQSPRDDQYGTASASRIWPPPSSRQSGLRRLGGVDC